MTQDKSSYQQIFKATSLFGGVQLFQILIQIAKSKFVAVLLGPSGMGIQGLLTSTTNLIAAITNCGLGASSIKNVAEANSKGDEYRIALIITILRKWVWATGLLGALLTLIFSPWLSQLTFGNNEYTFAFVWISVTLLLNQLSSGQMAILQGMRKLKYLANANLSGSVLGLLVSVPFYYYFAINGIVPAIIASSVVSVIRSWYFARKIKIIKVKATKEITFAEGKKMLKMGIMLSLSGLITLGASYLVRIYISNIGSIQDVGLYTAGFAIISSYVGLVFSAMGTDYYPRLSGVANNNQQAKKLINEQSEIAILILGPILTIFLVFINWIIIILYSTKFVPVSGMIHYAILGIYFKAVTWAIGYIFLAKGDAKVFFWSEVASNSYLLLFNILGYYFFGLTGMGISFLIGYIFSLGQVFLIAKIRYEFSFTSQLFSIFTIQTTIGIACFMSIKFLPIHGSYALGISLIGASVWHSYKELDRRVGFKGLLNALKRKIKH